MDYKEAWDYQVRLFNERVTQKLENRNLPTDQQILPDNLLLFTEHPHVFTLGKSGNLNNLLVDSNFLNRIHATYYHIDRGGDITYHGPGQLVGYPIFDLEQFGMHIKQYIFTLEEAMIKSLEEMEITASRLSGATGVWLDPGTPDVRKICAIGVKAGRHVTMHGFALNVNTDLSYFGYINPCGFRDKGVTSMAKELDKNIDMQMVKLILMNNIVSGFLNYTAKSYF